MKFVKIFYGAALHFAVEEGNVEIIKCLLSNNMIDKQIKDQINAYFFKEYYNQNLMIFKISYSWKTPIEYTKNEEIISLFK